MQPYFYPYAGYFRLLAASDVFVVFDDVQFPRRGRVHRCQVPSAAGALEWLTLPLRHALRGCTIHDLQFAGNARGTFDRRLRRYAWIATSNGELADRVRVHLRAPLTSPLFFVEAGLRLVADALGLPARIIRSSSLDIDPTPRGQERIVAIVRALRGDVYLNASGGRALYDGHAFRRQGVRLRFLRPYEGRFAALLPALLQEPADALRADVLATAHSEE
jgi:hypothetical protein